MSRFALEIETRFSVFYSLSSPRCKYFGLEAPGLLFPVLGRFTQFPVADVSIGRGEQCDDAILIIHQMDAYQTFAVHVQKKASRLLREDGISLDAWVFSEAQPPVVTEVCFLS